MERTIDYCAGYFYALTYALPDYVVEILPDDLFTKEDDPEADVITYDFEQYTDGFSDFYSIFGLPEKATSLDDLSYYKNRYYIIFRFLVLYYRGLNQPVEKMWEEFISSDLVIDKNKFVHLDIEHVSQSCLIYLDTLPNENTNTES